MSLARSLLALVALAAIAVVNAHSNCVTKDFGRITTNTVPLEQAFAPPPGGELTIPIETCVSYGHPGDAVGERVTTCNVYVFLPAPALSQEDLRHVSVDCGSKYNCPKGTTVDTTLYCP